MQSKYFSSPVKNKVQYHHLIFDMINITKIQNKNIYLSKITRMVLVKVDTMMM